MQPTTTVEICDTLNDEIGRLAESLTRAHGGAVTAVVVLIYVTTCLFTHYGDDHMVDLRPPLAVQRGAVEVFLARKGVGSGKLDEALVGLSRANRTVDYLASFPG